MTIRYLFRVFPVFVAIVAFSFDADDAPEDFMAAYGLDEPLGRKSREIGYCGEKLKLVNLCPSPNMLVLSFADN